MDVEAVRRPAATITHQTLERGEFPYYFKNAIVKPQLKKPSLDKDELKKYSLILNLHFISNVI